MYVYHKLGLLESSQISQEIVTVVHDTKSINCCSMTFIFNNVWNSKMSLRRQCLDHLIQPGDSGQTPARSICLKFAGPTIRTTRHLLRSFLESRIQRTITRKSKLKPLNTIFLLTGLRIYTGEYKAQGPTLCPTEGRALRGPRALYSPV